MAGWLDVPDPHPPPPTVQFGPIRKQETKGGGLRTAVAPALLLVSQATERVICSGFTVQDLKQVNLITQISFLFPGSD